MSNIFDKTFSGVERALDLRFKRHAVLTSNAANSETPNYKARELDFAGQLQKAFGENTETLTKTSPRHMDLGMSEREHIVLDNTVATGADGNNVDLDVTMGRISSNARDYETAAGMLSQKFRMLRLLTRRGGA